MKPKIVWPGMSKARLGHALRIVAIYARDNSCSCDKGQENPERHRKGCWTRGIAADLRIVRDLADACEADLHPGETKTPMKKETPQSPRDPFRNSTE